LPLATAQHPTTPFSREMNGEIWQGRRDVIGQNWLKMVEVAEKIEEEDKQKLRSVNA
jgi:hypothetical protein